MIFVVSGVDGSGKTSVIDCLQKTLESRGLQTRYVWLRYNHYLSKFVLAFCRYTGLTRYFHFVDSRVVYHDFHRSKIISWLFIATTFIDTLFASFFKVYLPALFTNKVIVCDRWVYDIMVDLEVDTRVQFSDGRWLKRLFLSLLPSASVCFVITREQSLVRGARDESLNDDNFPVRCELYLRHAKDGRLHSIDNNGSIEQSVEQIFCYVEAAGSGARL